MNVISKLITYDFTYYGSRPCCACACTLLAWRMSPRKPPKHPYAQHRPSAPRMPLDPLRAVGAVQVGAAVGAEVVTGLYVDHRVPAHGALLSLTCSHLPCSRIRFILLILAGTVPAAAAIRPMRAPAPGLPPGRIPTDPPWTAGGGKTRNRQRRPDATVRHTHGKGT